MNYNNIITSDFINRLSNVIDLFDWSSVPQINLEKLREKHNYTGLDYKKSELEDIIKRKIDSYISRDGSEHARHFLNLISRSYSFKHLLENQSYEKYRVFIENIYSWTKNETLLKPENLLQINSIKDLFYDLYFLNSFDPEKSHWGINTRIMNVANSTKRLQKNLILNMKLNLETYSLKVMK